MDNYLTILETISKNNSLINEKTETICNLGLETEKTAAIQNHNMTEYKALKKESDSNIDRIKALSDEIQALKIANLILLENAKCSFADYAGAIILQELKKYSGKKYGEKTKEKIYQAVNAYSIGFYFEGYSDGKSRIKAYPLKDGYKAPTNIEIDIYAVNADGKSYDGNHTICFVDTNNTINGDAYIKHNYRYVDDIAGRVQDIKNAFTEYVNAFNTAATAQTALNNLLPECMSKFRNVDTIPTLRLINY